MDKHSTEFLVTARYAELPRLMDYITQKGNELGAAALEISRIQLILEELFSNTVAHAYQNECDQLIGITLQASSAGFTLIYCDQGPLFDLSDQTARPPEQDQIGGLGINLILGMARAIRYQRLSDWNMTDIDL
ncbi:MAG: ATP-binding protein [Rhodocyclaceae bacterium]|nr:ATP-binding protein [Rhodocyclaceae bacterium]